MEPRWLLLGHQLPARRSNARVKTWRRLQQLGAVPTRNSVYVLPNTEQCREDFEWLRSEIVALGGQATVFAADAISEGGAEDIVATFKRARAQDYRGLKRDVDRLLSSLRRKRRGTAKGQPLGRAVRALRDKFAAIERADFFRADSRDEAAAGLATLEQAAQGPRRAVSSSPAGSTRERFDNRRWVTRPRPGVDRMASAWLIRKFIDRAATFVFADVPEGPDVAFDMYTGEFSHRGGLCTFEVLADRFGLSDPAVARIAQIVHDLDMKEAKYAPPEAPAVGRMVDGLRALHSDDGTLLEQGINMFEALARSFESSAAVTPRRGRPPR